MEGRNDWQLGKNLEESERWLGATLKSIGDAVIATDIDDKIKFINPAAEAMLSCGQAEVVGKQITDLFYFVDKTEKRMAGNILVEAVRNGSSVTLTNQALLVVKSKRKITVDVGGAPIRNDDNELCGMVLILRDVTRHHILEKEALKVQMLGSIGLLAGGIAHDFNNYLTAVLGFISLAQRCTKPDTENFLMLKKAEDAVWQAQRLTRQLLSFSKNGSPIGTPAHIGELIKETAKLVIIGSDVKCEFSVADDLWAVDIDEVLVAQAIANLIINAKEAMPEGGTIHVTGANLQIGEQHDLPLAKGNYIKIAIADQGIGIAPELLARIFDPYFTTKPAGHGVGLALTHSIVKNYNGHITVKSTVGSGTTFEIYLPASKIESHKPDPIPEEQVREARQEDNRRMCKVLIMDDLENTRELVRLSLENVGYEVIPARNGEEAIDLYIKAKESNRPLDAVILDLVIPGGVGGKKTISRLIAIDPHVKAILSSGYPDDPIVCNFTEHGFSAVLRKPYRITELVKALDCLTRETASDRQSGD